MKNKEIVVNKNTRGKLSRITSHIPETLGKTFKLDQRGEIHQTTAAQLLEGEINVLEFESVADVVRILKSTGDNQALCNSLPINGMVDAVLVTKKLLAKNPDAKSITRSKEHLVLPSNQPGILTLDYDPPKNNEEVLSKDYLWTLLNSIVPAIKDSGVIWWCSGSSYIFNGGREHQGLRGQRIYILIQDLSDVERFGEVLAKRLWLCGHGAINISKSGQKLIRSTFDEAMFEPARFDFIGGAVCFDTLEQRRGEPEVLSNGGWLDTLRALPSLTSAEEAKYLRLVEDAKLKAESASIAAKEVWLEGRMSYMVEKLTSSGLEVSIATERAMHCLRSALDDKLHGDYEIILDDEEVVSVGHILDNREKYHGRLTKDPLEPEYQNRKTVGKLYLFGSTPNLYSFARGGRNFNLRRQPARLNVVKGGRAQLADEIIKILRNDGDIFSRAEQLVQIGQGKTTILKRSALAHAIGTRVSLYSKNVKGVDCPTDVTGETCDMVSAMSSGFNELKAYTTLPFVRTDGSIVDTPGYDLKTQTYANFLADSFPPITAAPDRSEVIEALKALWRPWSAFPFATDGDRGAMLSAIFTAICRPSLSTAPAYFFDAPVQGSGKTLCAETLGALVLGRSCGVTPFVHGEYVEAEWSKQIVSMLIANESFWLIDNVVGTWRSAVISAVITSGAFSGRVLGSSTSIRADARMLICATGNNASLDRDMGRRFIKIRIDTEEETPQGRNFDFHPISRVLKERVKIARAVLIVIRAYFNAGMPVFRNSTAGFGDWSTLIRQAVLWCSSEGLTVEAGIGVCDDPAASILEESALDDDETITLRNLLQGLDTYFPNEKIFQAKDLHNIWFKGIAAPNNGVGQIMDALSAIFGNKKDVNSNSFGKVLQNRKGRLVGGLKLVAVGRDRSKVTNWVVSKG